MARIEDIERRLLNWARWVAGGGGGGMGYARTNWGADTGARSGYREATIPTVDCEAEETDRAVLALPGELRAAVNEVYVETGTDADRIKRMQCGRSTLHARIGRAHLLLRDWFAELEAQRRAERARLASLVKRRPDFYG